MPNKTYTKYTIMSIEEVLAGLRALTCAAIEARIGGLDYGTLGAGRMTQGCCRLGISASFETHPLTFCFSGWSGD